MKSKAENIIELRNVSKYYKMGDNIVKALDEVNIKILRGDFVAIMGPSGSGKSTGMGLTGSLDLATHGEIFLDGQDIEHLGESELAQIRGRKIGFIFQQFNLIPTMTAKENVMLPMIFQGIEKEEREKRASELLKLVGLEEREDHRPNQLSGGQQQRVAIARSLANDPEVILADEPTGNLDSKTEKKIMDFLIKLNSEGKTIIVVTHSPEIAQTYANTIYWLKDGKVEKVTKRQGKKWAQIKTGKRDNHKLYKRIKE